MRIGLDLGKSNGRIDVDVESGTLSLTVVDRDEFASDKVRAMVVLGRREARALASAILAAAELSDDE